MTEEILFKHNNLRVKENKQFNSDIYNLTNEEQEFIQKLENNIFGEGIRLEQERIEYKYIEEFVEQFNL